MPWPVGIRIHAVCAMPVFINQSSCCATLRSHSRVSSSVNALVREIAFQQMLTKKRYRHSFRQNAFKQLIEASKRLFVIIITHSNLRSAAELLSQTGVVQ